MIEPFSLIFAEDGTAYGVEYEKGNRIFSISPGGQVQFIAGRNTPGGKKLGDGAEGDGGNMAGARFNGMHEQALHPDGKRIFIADTFNHRIRLLDLEAGTVSTFAGTGGNNGRNPAGIRKMVDRLKAAGNEDVKHTEFDGADHREEGVAVFNAVELMDWILEFERSLP